MRPQQIMPPISRQSAPCCIIIVIDRGFVALATLSLTWTVKLNMPQLAGVPEITPVDELRDNVSRLKPYLPYTPLQGRENYKDSCGQPWIVSDHFRYIAAGSNSAICGKTVMRTTQIIIATQNGHTPRNMVPTGTPLKALRR